MCILVVCVSFMEGPYDKGTFKWRPDGGEYRICLFQSKVALER